MLNQDFDLEMWPSTRRAALVPTLRGTIIFVVLCALMLMSALVSDGQTPAALAAFSGADSGGHLNASLFQANDGNFYGTTLDGGSAAGSAGHGTAFRLSADGGLVTLYAFTGGADGSAPTALTQATDGNLYGATTAGGAGGGGTVFRLTPEGALTTLHAFTGGADGATPNALTGSGDGSVYGTTGAGGAGGGGTVFRLGTDGALTTLHAFTGGADGAAPLAALVQGSDGKLYGTTAYGGSAAGYDGSGTVFSVTTDGALATLYAFTGGADGSYPFAPLIQGIDGAFYGTTSGSAAGVNCGTAFRVTTDGALTTLHAFANAADGNGPAGGLAQDGSGLLYGTTRAGGYGSPSALADGTLFSLTTDGALTTLHTFDGAADDVGANPAAALILSADGTLYGTAVNGGAGGAGTVFTLAATPLTATPPVAAAPTVDVSLGGNGALAAGITVGRINLNRAGGDTSAPLRVRYRLAGSAVNGVDYTNFNGLPLSGVAIIPAGQSRVQLKFYATQTVDVAKTIRLTLRSSPVGVYNLGDTTVASLVMTTAR